MARCDAGGLIGRCFRGRDPNEHGATEKSGKAGGGLAYWDQYTLGEQRYLSLGERASRRATGQRDAVD